MGRTQKLLSKWHLDSVAMIMFSSWGFIICIDNEQSDSPCMLTFCSEPPAPVDVPPFRASTYSNPPHIPLPHLAMVPTA